MSAPGNRDPHQGMLVASPLFGVRAVSDGGLDRQTDPRMAISRPELRGLDPLVLADLRRQASQNMVDVSSPEYMGLAAEAGARAVGPGAEVEGAEPKVAPGTELVRAAGAAPAPLLDTCCSEGRATMVTHALNEHLEVAAEAHAAAGVLKDWQGSPES